jgi:TM2 domain-containing membrane protein YozV
MEEVSNSLRSDEMYCTSCGKPVKKAAEICPHCGVRLKANPQQLKNPGLAAIASFFFSGLGQIYNGEIGKGLIFILIQFINVGLMLILLGFLTYPVVWIYGIYDAYTTAERINAEMNAN